MTYRVLVTGSRDWTDREVIHLALNFLFSKHGLDIVLVHGDCPTGADAIANEWATRRGLLVERHPADWPAHGSAAGPVRNKAMVQLGADICLAFIKDKSRGASHCLGLAEKAGMDVFAWHTTTH